MGSVSFLLKKLGTGALRSCVQMKREVWVCVKIGVQGYVGSRLARISFQSLYS